METGIFTSGSGFRSSSAASPSDLKLPVVRGKRTAGVQELVSAEGVLQLGFREFLTRLAEHLPKVLIVQLRSRRRVEEPVADKHFERLAKPHPLRESADSPA